MKGMKRFAETLIGGNDTRPLRALSMDSTACSVSLASGCGIQTIKIQGKDKCRIKEFPAADAPLLGKLLDPKLPVCPRLSDSVGAI
jgi:hypothetical protein